MTASTPDPADGRIERDPDGSPTGTLHEGAMDLVARLMPDDTPAELEEALRLGQAHLHGFGITAWQDAIVEAHAEERAYVALASRGELTARVVGALWWDRARGAEQIEEFVERRRGDVDRPVPGDQREDDAWTASSRSSPGAMLEPYLDGDGGATDNRGHRSVDPSRLASTSPALDALGFQPHFHAIGDRAVRETLDAIEAARRANGPTDTRPHIAHIQVIHPDDIPRFATLDVVGQRPAAVGLPRGPDGRADDPVPRRRAGDLAVPVPLAARAAGAALAMGSDWSVSTPNPFLEIEVAVSRVVRCARRDRAPFLPEERLDLDDALAAFTIGSAYVNHLDARARARSRSARLADLAVLDRDLFDAARARSATPRVVGTFVDGEAVYEDPALGG